ncbi:MAG: non-canonical purine NTP pyrophosphatase [Vampirovibrionales bacterium]|nr:non-canonical purine NTP pyrophosphatase [Vampirovibrionales bacterium]
MSDFQTVLKPSSRLILTLATSNPGKRREIQAMAQACGLALDVRIPEALADVDETGLTFAENARLKALAAVPFAASPDALVLAEDSGFCVHALAGRDGWRDFPGVRSNRWMTPALRSALLGIDASFEEDPLVQAHLSAGILALMAQESRRSAHYAAAMTLVSADGRILLEVEGQMPLTLIAPHEGPRGDGGFGYDPIVMPAGERRTVAELAPEEKNRLSHRAAAFQRVIDFLKTGVEQRSTEQETDS